MITLECDSPIAVDSPDHLVPRGTAHDNSTNQRFNNKLYNLFNWQNLSVLDLGCAGGGFVKNCIDDGFIAVGLEGSDYSKKLQRAEWKTIPKYLFTCDITRKFRLLQDGKNMEFPVITAWEVMEHIKAEDLPQLIENVKAHMSDGGLWIMSITSTPDVHRGVNLHQTTKGIEWWVGKFKQHGLFECSAIKSYFNTQYVRGKWDTGQNFHLVLTNNLDKAPVPPRLSSRQFLQDRWLGSGTQMLIKRILICDD